MPFTFDTFPQLSTARLLLRQLQLQDAEALFAIRSNAAHYRYINRAPYTSMEQAVESVSFLNAGIQAGRWVFWAFQLHDTPDLLGTVCFFNYKEDVQQAELGYELIPTEEGKGYAREAVKVALHYAFHHLHLKQVEAITNPHNKRSIDLLQHFGFSRIQQFNEPHFSGSGEVVQAVFVKSVPRTEDASIEF